MGDVELVSWLIEFGQDSWPHCTLLDTLGCDESSAQGTSTWLSPHLPVQGVSFARAEVQFRNDHPQQADSLAVRTSWISERKKEEASGQPAKQVVICLTSHLSADRGRQGTAEVNS